MKPLRLRAVADYVGKGNRLAYHVRWNGLGALKALNITRTYNALLAVFEWKNKRSVLNTRPIVLRLDPSAVCNLKCPTCITPKRQFQPRQARLLTVEGFQRIFAPISKYALKVTLYISGEPMTNPRLFDIIRVASASKAFTYICTNFTLMKESLLEPLFQSGLDKLSVCLDGFTQPTFERYRVRGDVERVKAGIRMVMDYKRRNNLKKPFLNVFTITFNHVLPELDEIKAFCEKEAVDQLTLRPDESAFDGSHINLMPKRPYSKCFWPWLSIQVDADGSVYPCSCPFPGKLPYGNLLEQSFEEIWNNELYVETRKFLSGQSPEKPELGLPCYNCSKFSTHGGEIHEPHNQRARSLPVLRVEDIAMSVH